MTVTAVIIKDSISPQNIRLTTMQLRFHRFILPEFNTHRLFSRNASSSRALPTKRLLEDIIYDTAMPVHWGKNQPGMQADCQLSDVDITTAKDIWIQARNSAIGYADKLRWLGVHKQPKKSYRDMALLNS